MNAARLAEQAVMLEASRNFGIFTVSFAVERGVPPRTVRRRINSGEWHEVFSGVLRPNGAPLTLDAERMAAIKWGDAGTMLSHLSAGNMFALPHSPARPIEITTRRKSLLKGVRVHHRADLPLKPEASFGPFPITRPDRTLLDLCGLLNEDEAETVVDDALRRKITNLTRLRMILDNEGRRGKRGTGLLRKIVEEREERIATDGDAEDLLRKIFDRAPDLNPVHHHNVFDGRRHVAELDFAFVPERLDVEADGFGEHGRRGGFESDRERDAELKSLGWEVLRFSWRQLKRKPEWVLDKVRATLEQRRALLAI